MVEPTDFAPVSSRIARWNRDWLVERLRRANRRLDHFWAVLALTLFHVMVFAPSLVREKDGLPTAIIPWDFLDSYHRFLVYISDTVRAGALPTWFPYGNAGMPFFLNPQSQLWSPLTWIVTAFGGYTLLVAQRQVILTLLLGGIGSYALAYHLCKGRIAATFAAISYSFTISRLANTEHLDIVNAFSLYPWLFWGVLRVSVNNRWAIVLLAFLGHCFIVSGYPGVVMVSPLWLGSWVAFVSWDQHHGAAARMRFLGRLLIAGTLGLLLAAGYWVPIALHGSITSRTEPLPVYVALSQALTLKDLCGLLIAWPAGIAFDGAYADVSMRGVYFGIIALPLAIAALVFRRDRLTAALGVATIGGLILGLGAATSVRQALNTYLPFLNVARFPSVDSRGIAILAASMLAGLGLQCLCQEARQVRRFVTRSYVGLVVLLTVAPFILKNSLCVGMTQAVFAESVVAPVVGQLLWLGVALIVLARGLIGKRLAYALCALSLIDLGANVQVNYNLVGQYYAPSTRATLKADSERTFDPAAALAPRIRFDDLRCVANNLAYTSSRFYAGSYGPFRLKTFEHLLAAGFIDWLATGPRLVAFPNGKVPMNSSEFVDQAKPVSFRIPRYLPDRVEYEVILSEKAILVFNEVYFPGWKASIDGGPPHAVREVAGGLRAVSLDAGSHRIRTWFAPTSFWVGAGLTLGGILIIMGWILAITVGPVIRRRKRSRQTEPVLQV